MSRVFVKNPSGEDISIFNERPGTSLLYERDGGVYLDIDNIIELGIKSSLRPVNISDAGIHFLMGPENASGVMPTVYELTPDARAIVVDKPEVDMTESYAPLSFDLVIPSHGRGRLVVSARAPGFPILKAASEAAAVSETSIMSVPSLWGSAESPYITVGQFMEARKEFKIFANAKGDMGFWYKDKEYLLINGISRIEQNNSVMRMWRPVKFGTCSDEALMGRLTAALREPVATGGDGGYCVIS